MANEIVAEVEYRELPKFPGYRFGSDGSVWSRWTSEALPDGGGRRSVLGSEWSERQPVVNPRSGYVQAQLRVLKPDGSTRYKTCRVHQLILLAFVGPCPRGCQGCHENGVRTDNRQTNLRWDTAKGNAADRARHGTSVIGRRHHANKLAESQVLEIRDRLAAGEGSFVIAKGYGVSQGAVDAIRTGKTWKHLLGPLLGAVK